LGIEEVCSSPDVDDPRWSTQKKAVENLNARTAAVTQLSGADIAAARASCLKSLMEARAILVSPNGPYSKTSSSNNRWRELLTLSGRSRRAALRHRIPEGPFGPIQHSVMARRWFKERWTQIVPWAIERSTYVLCASLALLLLFWEWRPIGIQIWSVDNTGARIALWALFAAGWATVLVVTFLINHFDLFGLRQVWLPLAGKPYTRVSFRTPLPYRFVRHPLYFGFLLAFWMTPTMTLAHLLFACATTAYIVLAIQFEERDLLFEHGVGYEEYRRAVPMLIPGRKRLPSSAAALAGDSRLHRSGADD
jgi:methanethiol S-methyltransferase